MQHVDVKVHDHVATIQMNAPGDKVVTLHPAMIQDLQTAFSDVHQERRVSGVILISSASDFCAGMDLKTFREIGELPEDQAPSQWFTAWNSFRDLLETILRFPKPVYAAIDGAAIGGGAALALAADAMIVSDRSRLAASAVHRGLVGGPSAVLLAFRAGASVAARHTMTGSALDAVELYRLGLSLPPVAADQIWVTASKEIEGIAQSPHQAITATKRLINECIGEEVLTQLAVACGDSATSSMMDFAKEGVAAFLDKREPSYE
ncbi:MAG: enoyl-CoA hydratase/isomerase family protein [Planctomycetota bacterium]